MKKLVHVSLRGETNRSYDIVVGTKLNDAGREIRASYPDSLMFIVTDSNVNKLYRKQLVQALFRIEAPTHTLAVPAGERSKSRETKEDLENEILSLNADRNSVIIALGGGMIGDLAGFVAATLLRGLALVQVPTSLLAMVDSSIGGKVAVDHPLGKNLIGAFYQPKKVYIDVDTLKTLPDREFSNGMAEAIKYAAILDAELFEFLEKHHSQIQKKTGAALIHVITRCIELKKMVVEKDEKETDYRRILNFGHTIGHAVEVLSNYEVSHGEAVAIGMVAEAKLSSGRGLLRSEEISKLADMLTLYGLPTTFPPSMSVNRVVSATLHDKKAKRGEVQYTLLEDIGRAHVGIPIPPDDVEEALRS